MSPAARALFDRANRARYVGLHTVADECMSQLAALLLTEGDA